MSLLTVPGVLVAPGSERDVSREYRNPDGSVELVPNWLTGVGFEPEDCDVPLVFSAGAPDDFPYWYDCPAAGGESAESAFETSEGQANGTKSISAGEDPALADAITIWAGTFCRAGSDEFIIEAQARAAAKLEALTPTAIERELWSGAIAGFAGFPNSALVDVSTLAVGGTPLGFVTALAELEQGIADSMPLSSPAIIHAQPRVVTAWKSRGLVERVPAGTHLVTATGTIVVPERGATGGPPTVGNQTAANYSFSWAYATSMVSVYLSPIRVTEAQTSVDRSVNDLEVRAERDFVVAWNPCGAVAARVLLCDEYCSGGS